MSTSSSSWLVLAIVLAGCNSLLGLDPPADDRDGDGIGDAVDNCPLDPNSQQRDSDGNGLGDVCDCAVSGADTDGDGIDDACDDCLGPGPTGVDSGGDGIDDGCEPCAGATGEDIDGDGIDDACDACKAGPPHDEDADGVADACDSCPAMANAGDADADGDGVGDACDTADIDPSFRQFDGFAAQDFGIWLGTVQGWTWRDDGLEAASATGTGRIANLRVRTPFAIETRLAAQPATDGATLHVSGSVRAVQCTIDAQRMLELVLFGPVDQIDQQGPVPGTGPVRLRLLSSPTMTACQALGDDGDVIVQAMLAARQLAGRIGLEVPTAARFEYLWVIGSP